MAKLELFCRIATPFDKRGELDEEAYRIWLQRFVKPRIGIYLGSGGGAEGHSLTWQELRRIYQIGVEECKGKIQVHANPPEQYSVRLTRQYIYQAIEAGVDMVSIYGLASRHGMRPTDMELTLYFKEVLAGVKHPISLGINAHAMGYTPKPEVMAEVCNSHPQVVALNLSHGADGYFVKFKERLKRNIAIYVHCSGSLNKLTMGAKGVFGLEANIIPKTQRSYLDAYESKNFAKLGRLYEEITRYTNFTSQWYPPSVRAIKMAIKLFKLPGWEGGLREPVRMPPTQEYKRFAEGLLRLGIPEIEQQARAAGLRIPK